MNVKNLFNTVILPWAPLYKYDIVLIKNSKDMLQSKVQIWRDQLEKFDLNVNVKKTDYMIIDTDTIESIKVVQNNYFGQILDLVYRATMEHPRKSSIP